MNNSNGRQACILAMVMATAVLAAGCANGPAKDAAARPAAANPAPSATTSTLTVAERTFMAKAAAKTLYELEVSRLAAERAVDARVRAYAQGMVGRQTGFTNELAGLMSAKGLTPPRSLTPEQAAKLKRLAAVPPSAAFDNGYVRVVGIEDHQSNIALLEQGRRLAGDRDLRAWIDKTLPTLRRQLGVAQALAGSIAG